MKAIILAAGRGSRMRSMTEDRPKCLVELHGKPLLEWQLNALNNAGINEIGIVTGYKRELLADRATKEFHNPRWMYTNMVSSLTYAHEWLEHEPCIVSYSDIFYEACAIESLIKIDADLAVTYDPNWLKLWQRRFADPLIDAETFRLNPDGTLAEIGKKPKTVREVQGQYMGLLRFTPRGWAEVMRLRSELNPETGDRMDMTTTLQKIIEAGRISVAATAYEKPWGEVDSIDDLTQYEKR